MILSLSRTSGCFHFLSQCYSCDWQYLPCSLFSRQWKEVWDGVTNSWIREILQYASNAPDIHFKWIGLMIEACRRHISISSIRLFRQYVAFEDMGNAEVPKFHLKFRVDEDILWLDAELGLAYSLWMIPNSLSLSTASIILLMIYMMSASSSVIYFSFINSMNIFRSPSLSYFVATVNLLYLPSYSFQKSQWVANF